MTTLLIYILLGLVAGLLAGLLGIGGGLVIVPALSIIFAKTQMPQQYIIHMALGTSLATIVFTSISSLSAHHKRGAVIWPVVFNITPGIIVGTLIGSWVVSKLSTTFLKGFFGLFLFYAATQMLLGIKPKPSRQIPGFYKLFGAGKIIGLFSSLVGIGGGTISVPFLVWCNTAMHKAIGTSAAIGFPIAVAGAVGYIINGIGIDILPKNTLGFIHIHALIGISAASILTAPIGARLAHSLPIDKLKKVFAILLYIVASRMILSIF